MTAIMPQLRRRSPGRVRLHRLRQRGRQRRMRRQGGALERALHHFGESALLAQDEALALRTLEVGAALRSVRSRAR